MNALSMLMADTVTVYNYRSFRDGAAIKSRWDRAVISGVQWKESANRNVLSDGTSKIDYSISIIIPANARASGGKTYTRPDLYASLPAGDASHWTLDFKQAQDVIVHGLCEQEIDGQYTINRLKKEYPACDIKAVGDNRNHPVPDLRHWKVRGI
ncbi:MAG: hypothetical protein LBI91_01195 [Spirochaetaceae bacterium]|jgi:hypothetical protein|nr:hypothetical protein [Spirochaetaceae bacterium]